MTATVPTPQEAARLALSAERDATQIGALSFRRWMAAYDRGHGPALRADHFGRLELSDAAPASPAVAFDVGVQPAWRGRLEGALSELSQRGRAYQAFAGSDAHADLALSAIVGLTRTATHLRRITVMSDAEGCLTGAFTWLHISGRTLRRIRADPMTPLHPSEWNEGRLLWIRDVACRGPVPLEMIDAIAQRVRMLGGRTLISVRRAPAGPPTLSMRRRSDESSLIPWLREQLGHHDVAA